MPTGDTHPPAGIYCRKCGYDLRAQTAPHRCPECGQPFDPADRKTFLSHPPRGAAWRWAKRAAFLLMPVLVLAISWAWLYRDWKNEQAALSKLGATPWKVEPLGGEKLKGYLGSAGWVLDRVRNLMLWEPTTEADFVYLKELKWVRALDVHNITVTDTGLVQLKAVKRLQTLYLGEKRVTDAGMAHLKEFEGLERLHLFGTQITDAGLAHLKECKGLKGLYLSRTQVTNAGLVHVAKLKGLQVLYLYDTEVTDVGLIRLKELNGLQSLHLRGTYVTPVGVETLRAALPGAKIILE